MMINNFIYIKMMYKNIFVVLSILSLISLTSSAYSAPIARQMAYMSAIAYQSVLGIQAWNCKLCSQYKINAPKPFFNLTSGVRGFTGYSVSLGAIVVSFKGADSINTFINELKIAKESYDKCNGCQISKNFKQLYLTVQSTVLANVQSLNKLYRTTSVYVTGHGLGGAFAIISALDINDYLNQGVDVVYTFGQPRVGNDAFAAYYTNKLPNTFRVINSADIVPHLPPTTAGYLHSSTQIWYQNNMQSYTICQGQTPYCSNSIPPNSWSLNDNNLASYLNLKTVSLSKQ